MSTLVVVVALLSERRDSIKANFAIERLAKDKLSSRRGVDQGLEHRREFRAIDPIETPVRETDRRNTTDERADHPPRTAIARLLRRREPLLFLLLRSTGTG
jgi:hypothetical protein